MPATAVERGVSLRPAYSIVRTHMGGGCCDGNPKSEIRNPKFEFVIAILQ